MIRFQDVWAGDASEPSVFRLTPAETRRGGEAALSSAVPHNLHHNTHTNRVTGRVANRRRTHCGVVWFEAGALRFVSLADDQPTVKRPEYICNLVGSQSSERRR